MLTLLYSYALPITIKDAVYILIYISDHKHCSMLSIINDIALQKG